MQAHGGVPILQWSPDKKHSDRERYYKYNLKIKHMFLFSIYILDGYAFILLI